MTLGSRLLALDLASASPEPSAISKHQIACTYLTNTLPLSALRHLAFQSLRNGCKVSASSADAEPAQSIINLDEFIAGLAGTSVVEDVLWESFPAVKAIFADYNSTTKLLCDLVRWVFLKQPAFSHVGEDKKKASPDSLQAWHECCEKRVPALVAEPAILENIKKLLMEPVKFELRMVESAGLDAVAPIVSQCVQNLLGAGLSREVYDDVMLKIPQKHKLRNLVEAFGQAGG